MIKKHLTATNILMIALILLFCNAGVCFNASCMLQDTAVQVKTGLVMIETDHSIKGDIFSWHEGLNWISHSQLWYLLVGGAYKLCGIMGLVLLCSFFNMLTAVSSLYESKVKAKASHWSIILTMLFTNNFLSFPNKNVRPSLISLLFLAITILVLLYCENKTKRIILFASMTWLTALFHGGTITILFLVAIVYTAIELIIDKNVKSFIWNFTMLAVGFVTSLLTPNLFNGWLYQKKQSIYPEIQQKISEWQPAEFSALGLVGFLIILIGMIVDDKTKQKDSKHLFKIALLCMFFIGTCLYRRIFLQLTLVILFFAPSAIDSFVHWFSATIGFDISKFKIEDKYIKVLSSVAIVSFICSHLLLFPVIQNNTINKIAETEGYDTGVIDFIKEKNYNKIYNDFNIGTWLVFNDVKVHIDNRLDPYLASYSGEDHIHNSMHISSLTHLDDFYEKYNPDAIILYVFDNDEELESGESYPHLNIMGNFIEEIDTFRNDRYKKVYENTIETSSTTRTKWFVYECVYNEDND